MLTFYMHMSRDLTILRPMLTFRISIKARLDIMVWVLPSTVALMMYMWMLIRTLGTIKKRFNTVQPGVLDQ